MTGVAGAPSAPARVLLVEDDPAIQRYVAIALEEMPVDLVTAGSLAQARRALEAGPFALLLCDLMLPDGSGRTLLAELAGAPDAPRAVAFSAGVRSTQREELEALGVWRVLVKPTPLSDLEACVRDALAGMERAPAPPRPGDAPLAAVPPDGSADALAWAAQTYFAGDAGLHARFHEGCRERFATDMTQGDAALARADADGLRRVLHSLKTVLDMVGRPALGARAGAGERAAHAGDLAAAGAAWTEVREALTRLRA